MTHYAYPKSDMLESWLRLCMDLAAAPLEGTISAGSRKIARNVSFDTVIDGTLGMRHASYDDRSGSKLKQLKRFYRNEDSIAAAVVDYARISGDRKYGSAAFNTYGAKKKGFTKQTYCIQSVVVTYWKGTTEMDVFYRTTEVVKKFAADLVFYRESIIPEFAASMETAPFTKLRIHLANCTFHPMFYWMLVPHLEEEEWTEHLAEIKHVDPKLYWSIMLWSKRYMDPRVQKFSQAEQARLAFQAMSGRDEFSAYVEKAVRDR